MKLATKENAEKLELKLETLIKVEILINLHFSDEVREQFIRNILDLSVRVDTDFPGYLESEPSPGKDIEVVLNLSFEWSETPQGHDYWDNISETIIQTGVYPTFSDIILEETVY